MRFLDLRIAHHKVLLWIIAFVITFGSVVYQRRTGPTYPVKGEVTVENSVISFRLLRSETVNVDAAVTLNVADPDISGFVRFRRYKSYDDWTIIPFQRKDDKLVAHMPHQPSAGKLMYFVYIEKGDQKLSLSGEKPVILRYKGAVPAAVLIPHILLVFLAMIYSNRAALEALDGQGKAYQYMLWTMGLFFIGGMICGPIVQKYAFGAFWTGFPFGHDLTDNKALFAMISWIVAWILNRKKRDCRVWIILAALFMMLIYLIPHSLLGSELDYTQMEN